MSGTQGVNWLYVLMLSVVGGTSFVSMAIANLESIIIPRGVLLIDDGVIALSVD